jgi:uncharacterized protein (DUF362 family)
MNRHIPHRIERRTFLKSTAAGALALSGAGGFVSRLAAQPSAPSGSTLALAVGDSATEITRRAIAALGGIRAFVHPGADVVIKPNIGWARAPEYAANTNPEVVVALVHLCLQEAQAGSVLVADRSCDDARQCYALSGIAQAAQDAGAEVAFTRDADFVDQPLGGVAIDNWPVHTRMMPAPNRVLINVPIAKHHGLPGLTLGMKNLFGSVGGNRGRLHQDIHQTVVDLTAYFRPALTVIDATRILLRHGPTGGDLADVEARHTVIASADPVAAEASGASLFGRDPASLPWIVNANARGLGAMDLARVRVERVEV